MSAAGTFTGTGQSWRSAFLNSPGTPGSNFSYTTPALPSGPYTVRVRRRRLWPGPGGAAGGARDRVGAGRQRRPGGRLHGRLRRERLRLRRPRLQRRERAHAHLRLELRQRPQRLGPGAEPHYTAAGAFTVTLTIRDEYGLTGTATRTVTLVVTDGWGRAASATRQVTVAAT
jgi:large repetitive protein